MKDDTIHPTHTTHSNTLDALDCISRQAAIDAIEKHLRQGDEIYWLTDTDKIMNHAFEIAASCVYNLPSAQFDKDINVPDKNVGKIDDLIDRQVAIEYIRMQRWRQFEGMTIEQAIIKMISEVPSAQPEIIRCKDCKYNYNTCLNHGKNQPMCDFTDRRLKEDDFCSRAERREDG